MAQSQPTLDGLAARIVQISKDITSYMSSHGQEALSFAPNSPPEYPKDPEVRGPRLLLIGALLDMLHLVMGANDFLLLQPFLVRHHVAAPLVHTAN